jgi:hypothetical protein
MMNTHNGRAGPENAQGNGNPPPPPCLAQAIASILESRDEQTKLLRQLVANSAHGGNGARNVPAPAPTTYDNFAATHPSLFTEAGVPLKADHWLWVMESKFGLLRCTKVSWAEFRDAFCIHYIPAGVMRKKRQEFMDLNQGGRFVHDYSKQFNQLVQYALDQVDTDDKKKDRFMIGLSTKL